MKLVVRNLSKSKVNLSAKLGNLSPQQERTISVTVADLEKAALVLSSLEAAGVISWSTSEDPSQDDRAEGGIVSLIEENPLTSGFAVIALGASGSLSSLGMSVPTLFGTLSHPTLATGSLLASTPRAQLLSAATADSSCELRSTSFMIWRGNAGGLGGFSSVFRFGCATNVATSRMIVGWLGIASLLPTTQDPAALTSCVFVGNALGQANLSVMHNDAADACTQIDLGSDFPVPSLANGFLYEATFSASPNSETIEYQVRNLNTNVVASGVLATDLPPSTTFLAPHMYMNNGGTASAVSLVFLKFYKKASI